MEVKLRAVECAVALVYNIGLADGGNGVRKSLCGNIPILDRADVILGHRGKLNLIRKSEEIVNLVKELCNSDNLVLNLLGSKDNVSVVLSEAAYTEQSVKRTRKLISVNLAQFAVTERKLSV